MFFRRIINARDKLCAPGERPTWDANTPMVLRFEDGWVGDNIQMTS